VARGPWPVARGPCYAMTMKRIAKHVFAAVILVLSVAGQAAAGPFEDGLDAASRGDYATAIRLWRPLADQGNAIVQTILGTMYTGGGGIPQDYATAVSWYRRAADQGNPIGQQLLGDMYANGHGVPQDYVLAHMWFNLAAATGMVETAAADRDMVAAKMTPAQIAEAQKLAREWKPK
jgi:TPR repeat protein